MWTMKCTILSKKRGLIVDIYGKFNVYKRSKRDPVFNEQILRGHKCSLWHTHIWRSKVVEIRAEGIVRHYNLPWRPRCLTIGHTVWGGCKHSTIWRRTKEKQHTPQRPYSTRGIGNWCNIIWRDKGGSTQTQCRNNLRLDKLWHEKWPGCATSRNENNFRSNTTRGTRVINAA
jgi:hypothetical protein